ncbi:hypothetical protein [Corallincola spongiicola]|uniref:Transglutaminase domain-containing protein n=1 Tax=Corallincola spongiicola TaxID=2520508 RepID=A0ABY1WRB1_9GAMM|nr:hypothetical protein [Corallincola spongiicola]TAA47165.1 hypothetical protein EXY25_07945 [Corallincola spongiicola]
MNKPLLWLALLCLVSAEIHGKQISAQQQYTDTALNLSFSWLDRQKNTQSLAFAISNKALQDQQEKVRAYRPQIADRNTFIALQKAAANYDYKQVQINITQQPHQLSWRVKADDPELRSKVKAELAQAAKEAQQAYYKSNHYKLYTSPWGEEGVIPDHAYYMELSMEAMKPLGRLLKEKFPTISARQMADFILPFVQSIPYVTQDSRITSAGLGYLPPLRVLAENRGDCDSKAVLMAAILKAVYPQLNAVMIYMPNHAMLGLRMPYLESDIKITADGINYLVAEVAGPGLFPLAEASDSSKNAIANNHFSVLELP